MSIWVRLSDCYLCSLSHSKAVENFLASNSTTLTVKTCHLIGWALPPVNFHKLNTDGSAILNPGKAGAEGLIRDHHGQWVAGFSRQIGFTPNFVVELWGLRDGLRLDLDLNIKKLHISIDAQAVLSLLQLPVDSIDTYYYSSLIYDLRWLLNKLEEYHIQHSHRESNQ